MSKQTKKKNSAIIAATALAQVHTTKDTTAAFHAKLSSETMWYFCPHCGAHIDQPTLKGGM